MTFRTLLRSLKTQSEPSKTDVSRPLDNSATLQLLKSINLSVIDEDSRTKAILAWSHRHHLDRLKGQRFNQ